MQTRLALRRGFTLIELLIVVVVISILAALVIQNFSNTKGKAYYASMRSDLHNLTNAEESFFYDHNAYTTALDSMVFTTSPGVTVTVSEATVSGWSASSTHALAYPHICAFFVGTAAPLAPATVQGVVACN